MQSNVIAFDRTRKSSNTAAKVARTAPKSIRDNVISLTEYRSQTRARRTANGVFFSTGVLCTFGTAA